MVSIPNCVPYLMGNEAKYLEKCIRSGWVSSVGPFVDQFEQMFAQYHGVANAVSASSGTAAIHLGLVDIGVGANDLVICPTMTFVGTANPVRYCGADVVLLDCDPHTLNVDANCLEDFLSSTTTRTQSALIHRESGRRIAAIIVVHLYGNPADMQNIVSVADSYGLPLLEDSAESLGARHGNRLVGTFGAIGCFSFNGNKVITTGGGGMLIGRDPDRVSHCKHLSTTARTDKFDFVHDEVGFNYRLSNVCAAIGVAQMEQLDEFISLKRRHAEAYKRAFGRYGMWKVIGEPEGCFGTYWMVLARSADPHFQNAFEHVRAVAAAGCGIRPVWRPLHTTPAYANAIYFGGNAAVRCHETTFCLPSSVGLNHDDIQQTVAALENHG